MADHATNKENYYIKRSSWNVNRSNGHHTGNGVWLFQNLKRWNPLKGVSRKAIRERTSRFFINVNVHSLPWHTAFPGLCVLAGIVQTKGPRSGVTCFISSGDFSCLALRPSGKCSPPTEEGGESGVTSPQSTPHRREHIRTAPHQPTHSLTQTNTLWACGSGCHLIRVGSLGGSFVVGSHGVTHTDTPLHFCFPIGREGSNTWNEAVCFCPGPAALGNSPPRRPALPRH